MTWAVLLSIIFASLLKLLITCLPTGAVEWIISKFVIHSKLSEKDVTVTIADKELKGEEKYKIINYFNEAILRERYYIYPGNEQNFLHPVNAGTPIIIDTKSSKKDVRLFIYSYNDRIDVVKQFKRKVIAYSLFPGDLATYTQRIAKDFLDSEELNTRMSG